MSSLNCQISISLDGNPRLEPVKVVGSPAVTHVKYRVVRA